MKFWLGLIITIIALGLPEYVLAHDESQPAFVFINYKATTHAPIHSSSVADFVLPHDVVNELFLVNTPISLAMDPTKLFYDQRIVENRDFIWDFGDGTKTQGTALSHTYQKIGSYFLTINATDRNKLDNIEIFRTFINVVSHKDYRLPIPSIKVLDKEASPGSEIDYDFNKSITLKSQIVEGTSPVVAWYWDLGDGTSSDGAIVTHTYPTFHARAQPILRVRDANGLIADATLVINNKLSGEVPVQPTPNKPDSRVRIILIIILIVTGIFVTKKKRLTNTRG